MLLFIGGRGYAAISTVTVTASLRPELANFADVPLSFQQFDPSLGKLSSVEIILQGTGQITQQYENTAYQGDSERVRQTLNLVLAMPNGNGKGSFLKAHQAENHQYSGGSYDGAIDFGGTSGETGIYDITASDEKLLQGKKNLAMFTGSGLADLFLSAKAPFHAVHPAKSSIVEAWALTGADITITYHYIPAPEPAWYGLSAGALGLAAALRRKNKNRRLNKIGK
jgi:hypothetical protein